jgi:hypothetical protein
MLEVISKLDLLSAFARLDFAAGDDRASEHF